MKTPVEIAIEKEIARGMKTQWSDMDFSLCASSCLQMTEALKLAIEALKQIEDLQPMHERDRRTISREAIAKMNAIFSEDGK